MQSRHGFIVTEISAYCLLPICSWNIFARIHMYLIRQRTLAKGTVETVRGEFDWCIHIQAIYRQHCWVAFTKIKTANTICHGISLFTLPFWNDLWPTKTVWNSGERHQWWKFLSNLFTSGSWLKVKALAHLPTLLQHLNIDNKSHVQLSVRWTYLSVPKLKVCEWISDLIPHF